MARSLIWLVAFIILVTSVPAWAAPKDCAHASWKMGDECNVPLPVPPGSSVLSPAGQQATATIAHDQATVTADGNFWVASPGTVANTWSFVRIERKAGEAFVRIAQIQTNVPECAKPLQVGLCAFSDAKNGGANFKTADLNDLKTRRVDAMRVTPRAWTAVLALVNVDSPGDEDEENENGDEREGQDVLAQGQPTCSDERFQPVGSIRDAIKKGCEERDELCLTPSGLVLHQPELTEGMTLTVVLHYPLTASHVVKLEVEFKQSQVMEMGGMLPVPKLQRGGDWATIQRQVRLTSAGTLEIRTALEGQGVVTLPENLTDQAPTIAQCQRSSPLVRTHVFPVTGHYHFMVGIMPVWAGLYETSYTLHRGDDGVARVYRQDSQELEIAATLSAYPFGVSTDEFAEVGLVLGAGLRNLGQRWYTGIEITSPIGFGVVGGLGLIVADELDEDFQEGQPFAGSQVPTHKTVEPTWFVGVNIQAELFRYAFKGLADED